MFILTVIVLCILIFFLIPFWLILWHNSRKEDQDELELMYYNDKTVFDYLDIHVDKNTPGKNNRYD